MRKRAVNIRDVIVYSAASSPVFIPPTCGEGGHIVS